MQSNEEIHFTRALTTFQDSRNLTFTLGWARFPWTRGPELERALVGPDYLGGVRIGLYEGWCWGFEGCDGYWLYVARNRLDVLVDAVIDHRAGLARPPLPRRR